MMTITQNDHTFEISLKASDIALLHTIIKEVGRKVSETVHEDKISYDMCIATLKHWEDMLSTHDKSSVKGVNDNIVTESLS